MWIRLNWARHVTELEEMDYNELGKSKNLFGNQAARGSSRIVACSKKSPPAKR